MFNLKFKKDRKVTKIKLKSFLNVGCVFIVTGLTRTYMLFSKRVKNCATSLPGW